MDGDGRFAAHPRAKPIVIIMSFIACVPLPFPELLRPGNPLVARVLYECKINIIGQSCGTTSARLRSLTSPVDRVSLLPILIAPVSVGAGEAFALTCWSRATYRPSMLVSRNIRLSGRKTSIRLEPEFWAALDEIASKRGVKRSAVIEDVQTDGSLTSAVRVAVLEEFRK